MAADSQGKASRRGSPALPLVFVGVLGGLAWSAAFRADMVELAGTTSAVDWAGTFLAVLLRGAAMTGLPSG